MSDTLQDLIYPHDGLLAPVCRSIGETATGIRCLPTPCERCKQTEYIARWLLLHLPTARTQVAGNTAKTLRALNGP